MIKHVVMWKFEEALPESERRMITKRFEQQLQEVLRLVAGTISIELIYNVLDSSNMDLMLIGTYESVESLSQYQEHPMHKQAALLLKDKVMLRACVDY